MPELITLDEDGPLGPAGTQVWVDDPSESKAPTKPKRLKTTAEPVDKI